MGEPEPDLVHKRALAMILHDFYTGTERIFERIARELEGGLPSGPAWDGDLLDSMALSLPEVRPPVLKPDTAKALTPYLGVRHKIRNLYGRQLDWEPLADLGRRLPALITRIREEIESFCGWLTTIAEGARD